MSKAMFAILFLLSTALLGQEADIRRDARAVPLTVRELDRQPLLKNGMFFCHLRYILLEYGREFVHSPLILQWLFEDVKTGSLIVKYEKTVTEAEGLSLSIDSVDIQDDRLDMKVSGIDTTTLEEKNFTLQVFPDGVYRVLK